MKKIVTLAVTGVLAFALVAPADAKPKKPKKPKTPVLAQVDQKMFLRGDGCDEAARAISVVDAVDLDNCAHLEGGVINEYVPDGTMGPLDQPSVETWPAIDGVPLKLDASKHVTGEIYTQGVFPLVGAYAGLGAGYVRFTVTLVGESGGEEKVIGEYVDAFTIKPGDSYHTTVVDIVPDAALNGAEFTSLLLKTKIGGESVGQVFYKTSEPSSFITIPTLVAR